MQRGLLSYALAGFGVLPLVAGLMLTAGCHTTNKYYEDDHRHGRYRDYGRYHDRGGYHDRDWHHRDHDRR